MTLRPRLLDLFCGAGGAAVGYHRAGFDVVGVDIKPQPHYPFEFHQADALTYPLEGFDAIHASPPCQAYSATMRATGSADRHPDLLHVVQRRLTDHGGRWVVENVDGAPFDWAFALCGWGLGMPFHRHRFFRLDTWALVPSTGCPGNMPERPEHQPLQIEERSQHG